MWNRKNAGDRIDRAIAGLKDISIRDLTSAAQLDNIGVAEARRVDAAHGYVEILNAPALVETDNSESERSHKRLLRFLHVYQRVAHLVLQAAGAIPVDYQHHRLHFVVVEPLGDERARVARAVLVGDTLQRLLAAANELHPELPDARIRVGIDSGRTLAVFNGTRGDREPLFIGNAANHAAKLLAGRSQGVFPSDAARRAFRRDWGCPEPGKTALTSSQLAECAQAAGVTLDLETLTRRWREEVQATPLADFTFDRPRPPLSDLDLDTLGVGSSRRIDSAVVYADIDGFTRYVAGRVSQRSGEEAAVRALHVIRKELRDVLHDAQGKKIRYIGDCLVGWIAEGPGETDNVQTVTSAVVCAAAMRDSFGLVQEKLPDTKALGLAIGIDAGPVAVTQLGVRGTRFRCAVGRAVGGAEAAQSGCDGTQTALGEGARAWAGKAIAELFPSGQPQVDIGYNRVQALLDVRGEARATAAAAAGIASIRPRAWGTPR